MIARKKHAVGRRRFWGAPLLGAVLLWGWAAPPAWAGGACAPELRAALEAATRTAENRVRDRYRRPYRTLCFFGVRPHMTVVEVWPGGGWYTEILAPLLRREGKLYAAHFSPDSEVAYFNESRRKFLQKMRSHPVYGRVEVTSLYPPGEVEFAPAGTVDRVLVFRNVHNWVRTGRTEEYFRALARVLKPGGKLGVVQHRAAAGADEESIKRSGYVPEDFVIAQARAAGLRLLARGEFNANPADSRDHPEGVWTLPPSLRLEEKDREKYLAIGESDRMTLLFGKPREGARGG